MELVLSNWEDTESLQLVCTLFDCCVSPAVGQVSNALQLSPEDFKEKYGGTMPSQTENVVFTCLAGVRSKTALDTAASLGYSK